MNSSSAVTKNPDILRDKLASIGINFAANMSGQKNCDPELVLIEVLESGEFPESKSLIRFVLALLLLYGNFFHAERIKSAIGTLSPLAVAILGGIALKLTKTGDLRWNTIYETCKTRLGTQPPKWGPVVEDKYAIKNRGTDPEFLQFGITCPVIEPEAMKKIRPISALIEDNTWFRNRALFGTNMRADTITAIQLYHPRTPYSLSKILRCSMDCAYRNWKDLSQLRGKTITILL